VVLPVGHLVSVPARRAYARKKGYLHVRENEDVRKTPFPRASVHRGGD
jgi:hypothetical protein